MSPYKRASWIPQNPWHHRLLTCSNHVETRFNTALVGHIAFALARLAHANTTLLYSTMRQFVTLARLAHANTTLLFATMRQFMQRWLQHDTQHLTTPNILDKIPSRGRDANVAEATVLSVPAAGAYVDQACSPCTYPRLRPQVGDIPPTQGCGG